MTLVLGVMPETGWWFKYRLSHTEVLVGGVLKIANCLTSASSECLNIFAIVVFSEICLCDVLSSAASSSLT